MPLAPEPKNLRAVGDRIEELLGELRASLDPVAWRRVEEIISLVTDLYGGGLAAVVRAVVADGEAGPRLMGELLADELVSSLLVLHGLHPQTLEDRVGAALADVRPYLLSHGGDVEVLELDGGAGAIRLRLLGSCDGCPSSSATLKYAVEAAIGEAAPEIGTILVEGYVEPEPPGTAVRLSAKPVAAAVGTPT